VLAVDVKNCLGFSELYSAYRLASCRLQNCRDETLRVTPAAFKNCALLGYYAASNGNSLPTFRDNLPVPSSGANLLGFLTLEGEDFLIPEDGTDRLYRNSSRNYHYWLCKGPEERSSYLLGYRGVLDIKIILFKLSTLQSSTLLPVELYEKYGQEQLGNLPVTLPVLVVSPPTVLCFVLISLSLSVSLVL
jgi:hypothetical protein